MARHLTRLRSAEWLLLALASVTMCGCGYGPVSPCAYECASALYSICNRMANDKLATVAEHIQQAKSDGRLSQQEAAWLEAIVSDAGDGDWQSACNACRAIMKDQVQGG